MSKLAIALVPAMLILGACSDLNPYDRSEYEKADKPISRTTNKKMVSEMNAAPKADPSNPFAEPEEPDDWGSSTPRD